jgi:peptidoglycan L-alanyl-D-glutamate endopeptidase CwlK
MSNVTSTIRDISRLKPAAKKACEMFMAECKRQGVDIFITETLRTKERQEYLYAQGRTRPGQIVTWTLNSRHMTGLAWDIACNGKNLYDANTLKKAGEIAKKLKITWGGDWSPPDTPHFEVKENWAPPVADDQQLEQSVHKIALYGVLINEAAWNRLDRINVNYGQALIEKICRTLYGTTNYFDAVDALYSHGIISNYELWRNRNYTACNIRDLLVKVASKIDLLGK